MVTWLTPLQLEDAGDGRRFRLLSPLAVEVDGVVYTAPAGMLTDGASIPRLLWRAVGAPWSGTYRRAAVVHDAAYRGELVGPALTRAQADALFRRLMAGNGVSHVRRWLMWAGVRVGGWTGWRAR